jgi:hypothetical protein
VWLSESSVLRLASKAVDAAPNITDKRNIAGPIIVK